MVIDDTDPDTDNRAAAVLRAAKDILDRTAPSDAEVEEQEARRRRNRRVAVASSPAASPVIRKVTENAPIQRPSQPATRVWVNGQLSALIDALVARMVVRSELQPELDTIRNRLDALEPRATAATTPPDRPRVRVAARSARL